MTVIMRAVRIEAHSCLLYDASQLINIDGCISRHAFRRRRSESLKLNTLTVM